MTGRAFSYFAITSYRRSASKKSYRENVVLLYPPKDEPNFFLFLRNFRGSPARPGRGAFPPPGVTSPASRPAPRTGAAGASRPGKTPPALHKKYHVYMISCLTLSCKHDIMIP
nr:MAG TPA: hypothetical protein [Caudoviricetes sp.]